MILEQWSNEGNWDLNVLSGTGVRIAHDFLPCFIKGSLVICRRLLSLFCQPFLVHLNRWILPLPLLRSIHITIIAVPIQRSNSTIDYIVKSVIDGGSDADAG